MNDPAQTSADLTSTGTPIRTGFSIAPGGVRIHWRAVGSGPLFVLSNGVGVGADIFWKYLTEHFRDRYTIVLWDYRGHGRSDRALDPYETDVSIARHADDLALVIDDLAPDAGPVIAMGHSMGCQVSLELKRRHPDKVRALILALGSAGRTLETFFDQPLSLPVFRALHQLAFWLGPLSNVVIRPLLESPLAWFVTSNFSLVDPYYTQIEDMQPYLAHLASLDTRLFMKSVMAVQEHDAWDLLPTLDIPLLVIAAENDKFTPMWCSQKIVEQTPDAQMLVLAGASHAALIEQPETIHHRIDRFIRERLG